MREDAVTVIRSESNPDAPRSLQCELKQYATYHTWNHKRRESDKLEFVSFVPTAKYRTKKAGTIDVNNEKTKQDVRLTFNAGDEWTYLTYYSEDYFRMSFKGVLYAAGQDLFELSEEIKGQLEAKDRAVDQWMKLTCANTTTDWLLFSDAAKSPEFGESKILGYGREVDLRRLVTQKPPTPSSLKINKWTAGQ